MRPALPTRLKGIGLSFLAAEFTQPFIENVPQGENAPLNQVLVRAPNARAAGW
jgi:hypothetical protein